MLKITLTASALVLATAGASFAAMDQNEPAEVGVDASKAMIEGNKITNITVSTNKPGYLVIHNKGAGAPPASLGNIRVEPGTTGDVSIEAAGPIDPDSGVTLMLHYETNGNNSYDFGPGSTDVDTPVKKGDTVVNVPVGGSM